MQRAAQRTARNTKYLLLCAKWRNDAQKLILQLEIRCPIQLSYGRISGQSNHAARATAIAIALMKMSILLSTRETSSVSSVNALFVIAPYKYEGMWVFDDLTVGLSREPFIAGIDTMINKVVANIPNAERGFRVVFSATPFPGANFKLEWRREESGGNWYYNDRFKMEGWLCPALQKYFPEAPREIFVRAEPKQ